MVEATFSDILTSSTTKTKGIKGKIKQSVEDFIVSEKIDKNTILNPTEEKFNLPGKKGLFLHFVLIKRDIDNIDAVNQVAKIWKLPRRNFNFAGTKDKRALTGQRVSVWGAKDKFEKGLINEIDLPRIKTKSLCLRLKEVRLGDLLGNRFSIIIRDISSTIDETSSTINQIIEECNSAGGILNSFGIQRFGEIRPITHLVGKKLVEGDVEEALRVYVGKTFDGEPEETKEAREIFWKRGNVEESLEIFPYNLKLEIQILNELKRQNNDFIQAFLKIPLQLRKLFVHAYQSYLFNKYLEIRYRNFSSNLRKPIAGEMEKSNKIFAPILGYKSNLTGEVKEIYQSIIQKEGINQIDFQKDLVQKSGGKGTYRQISFMPENISITNITLDDLFKDKTKVEIQFDIEKGSYATEFLREIMK